jgi:ABC-type iron transport system FetAB ATPase subunit
MSKLRKTGDKENDAMVMDQINAVAAILKKEYTANSELAKQRAAIGVVLVFDDAVVRVTMTTAAIVHHTAEELAVYMHNRVVDMMGAAEVLGSEDMPPRSLH